MEDLLHLEHDALAAYDSSIHKLESETFRSQVASFRDDDFDHVSTLKIMAGELGVEAPKEGDTKQPYMLRALDVARA